ncbi:MAG TPA: PTS galactitol transporter subunit IIB [Actinobacteria bacterium]|nr:PTS galactitol transporter subunit IIB [Actinomycetota bacterium]
MNTEKNRKKKILCSCGTGIASCSFISSEIEKLLAENGVDAEIIKCRMSDINDYCRKVDLIISTAQLPPSIDKTKISGIPFITGNNLEETKEEILKFFGK